MVVLANAETVRAGRDLFVRVRGRDAQGVARAVTEARRHIRTIAPLGLDVLAGGFGLVNTGQREADGTYTGWIAGQTWRNAGNEYTVIELKTAMARAIPAGAATVAITVAEISDAPAIWDAIAATDTRTAGSVLAGVESGATRVTGALGSTLDAAVDVTQAASSAAGGIADFAVGAGEGAQGVGGFLRGFPLLSFGLLAAGLAGLVYLRVR